MYGPQIWQRPYSSTLLCAVPSAKTGLTSVFGMGTGMSPLLKSTRKKTVIKPLKTRHTFVKPMLDHMTHPRRLLWKYSL